MATEKRLIDKQTVIKLLRGKCIAKYPMSFYLGLIAAADEIEKFPEVDAVEVVRCKDWKHYDNSEGIQWCKINSKFYPGGFDWHSFPEDGFCSYGERKDNEDNT